MTQAELRPVPRVRGGSDGAGATIGHYASPVAQSAAAPRVADWARFEGPDRLPRTPGSFASAKQRALVVYRDHRHTFYCGCAFDARRTVNWQSCGYSPRADPRRAARIEWEHVVPAHAFGSHRACWTRKGCAKRSTGKKYGGRECCGRIDEQFRRMEADLQNLVPAVGEVNRDRAHYRFDEVLGEPREYGACDFEVDPSRAVAEPADELRGDIARAYLYMYHVYPGGLPLDAADLERFERWHEADPPSEWERTRNRRIAEIQRVGSPLVE